MIYLFINLFNCFSFYTNEIYTIFQKWQTSLWHGTYWKIKNLDTKLLIQVYLQIMSIHLALTVKVQLLSFSQGSKLLASSQIWLKVIFLFQRYVRHLKSYSILPVKSKRAVWRILVKNFRKMERSPENLVILFQL